MREIDTRVVTYDPEVYLPSDGSPAFTVMEVVRDGTGNWVDIVEHERLVEKLQQRIVYLENCCDEYMRELTGD